MIIVPQLSKKVVVKHFPFILCILRIYNRSKILYIENTSKNKHKTTPQITKIHWKKGLIPMYYLDPETPYTERNESHVLVSP
jgi:hypothetical protein